MKTIKKIVSFIVLTIFTVILLAIILPKTWVEPRFAWLTGSNYYTDARSNLNVQYIYVGNKTMYQFGYRTDDGDMVHIRETTAKNKKISQAKEVYKTITPYNRIIYCTNETYHYCF